MNIFSVEHKHWTLFCNMYTSISDKSQQDIILKVQMQCLTFLSYCINGHVGFQEFHMVARSH
jgi:hypothetical protein